MICEVFDKRNYVTQAVNDGWRECPGYFYLVGKKKTKLLSTPTDSPFRKYKTTRFPFGVLDRFCILAVQGLKTD